MIDLNTKNWELLQKINKSWNEKVAYRKDKYKYGKSDYWTVPEKLEGDCEDYAIAKQITLDGLDIGSKLATCWTETGRYHAVLIVETDKGSLVLDNRYHDVRRYEDLKYKWDKIEGDNEKWYAIV